MLGLVICHNSDRLKAPDNYLAQLGETLCLLANCFLFFCRDLAVFPTLLVDLQHQIQNGDWVPTPWAKFVPLLTSFTLMYK